MTYFKITSLRSVIARAGQCVLGTLATAVVSIHAAGVSDVPLVVYGKVTHVDQGATYQVFEGALNLTLTQAADPENSVTRSVQIAPTGEGGAFSYRIEFPLESLPEPEQLGSVLTVGANPVSYFMDGALVDGAPATALDPSAETLTTSFATRGSEHRLDLLVTLPQDDSDGDGLPDWWEELHGLNPLFAGDATSDLDGDGIDALAEFRGGTDPNASNADPTVVSDTVAAPEGGSAGLALTIIDSDTADADLDLSITTAVSGLSFRNSGGTLTPPTTFTYADVLAGKIVIDVAVGTGDSTVPMTLTDTTGANTPAPFNLFVNTFSPGNQSGPQPALWLEPSALTGVVSEWQDGSSHNRDGYQPTAADQPTGSAAGAAFDGVSEFLYLDDRLLALSEFSAFFAFNSDALTTADQVLFNGGGLDLRIGGSADPMHASTLLASRDGQLIEGPSVSFGSSLQATLTGNASESFLTVSGESLYASAATSETLPASFATIGGSQTIFEGAASQFFDGTLNEVLLYDTPLDAAQRSRVEDYQLSRWSGLVVWDARNATAPQSVTGHPGVRNALNGGWGDDDLHGASLADVLRGGPGRDRLTGHGGGDRFQIFPGHGDDTVTDFSEADGDILDLTPIFAGISGSPDNFLNIRTEIVRPPSGLPTINSVLEIDYDGGLDEVNQSVTLEGVALSNADLPRLVGGGSIQLCGPMYPTAVTIAASTTELTETVSPRSLTLTRTGNLDAPLELDLSFVGSATADDDYLLTGTTGGGAIRTVSFAPGISELVIGLTPVQDTLAELESIDVALLPSPQVTDGPDAPLSLTLADAPALTVDVLRRYAERLGAVPALVRFHRTGDLSTPLDVALQFTGSAENGRDYLPLSPNLTFPAGVATVEVAVTPSAISPVNDRPVVAQLAIVPDPARFALTNPWTGSVMIIDGLGGSTPGTFAAFRADNFPGNPDTDEVLGNTDHDSDFLSTLGEYVYGTDPNVADPAPQISIERFNSEGFVQIHATTAAGLTDASLELQFSTDLSTWQPVADDFILSYHWLSDGRIKRTYQSRLSANNMSDSGYYRAAVTRTAVTDLEATASSALGAPAQSFLAVSGPAWVPAPDGTQLAAPALTAPATSSFATFLEGAFTADFEWHADVGHRLSATLDGVEVASATGTGGWVPVNVSSPDAGLHELVWTIERTTSDPSDAEAEALRNLVILQP